MKSFCGKKDDKQEAYGLSMLLTSCVLTVAKINVEPYALALLICLFGIFILYSFFYNSKRAIGLSIILWFILGLCIEMAVAIILSSVFFVNMSEVVATSYVLVTVGVFASLAIKYTTVYMIYGRRKTEPIAKTFSIYQYIFFILSLIVLCNSVILFNKLIENENIGQLFSIYFFACLILMFVSVLYLFDKLIFVLRENEQVRLMKEQNRTQQNFVDEIHTLIEYFTHLKHDYNIHLQRLDDMSQQIDKKEMLDYLQKLLSYDSNINLGFIDNQYAVSLLLMRKAKEAKENNITFNCKVPNILDTKVKEVDLNVILGNLLDNAYEAVLKLAEGRNIDLEIYSVRDTFFIKVSNTYNGRLNMYNDNFISTKKESYFHGYGIRSVKRIVKNYDGVFNIKSTIDVFSVSVALNIY